MYIVTLKYRRRRYWQMDLDLVGGCAEGGELAAFIAPGFGASYYFKGQSICSCRRCLEQLG